MAIDTANFAGFSHAGASVMIRGSMSRPAIAIASAGIINSPVNVNGAFVLQSCFSMCPSLNVTTASQCNHCQHQGSILCEQCQHSMLEYLICLIPHTRKRTKGPQ